MSNPVLEDPYNKAVGRENRVNQISLTLLSLPFRFLSNAGEWIVPRELRDRLQESEAGRRAYEVFREDVITQTGSINLLYQKSQDVPPIPSDQSRSLRRRWPCIRRLSMRCWVTSSSNTGPSSTTGRLISTTGELG